jgi:RimJ/RimL family protein N-acetyltransferase
MDAPGIALYKSSSDSVKIPTLLTERLLLRSFRKSDIDAYTEMKSDPEVLRYLTCGPEPWDRGRAYRHMAFLLGHWYLEGFGAWAVEHRETGAFIGMIGFAQPEGWPGFELGWTLARRYWGYGYATEGTRKALSYAFTTLKMDRVISLIRPENQASIRVAQRIGEELQGRITHLGFEMLCFGLDREAYLTSHESLVVEGSGRAPF